MAIKVLQNTDYAVSHSDAIKVRGGGTLTNELDRLETRIENINQFPIETKMKIIECFRKVAWTVDDADEIVDELEALFMNHGAVVSIVASYTQSETIYPYSSFDDIKSDLVVKVVYEDNTEVTIQNYTLSGNLSIGISVVTVTYGSFTTTINVLVSDYPSSYSFANGDLLKFSYPLGLFGNSLGFDNNASNNRRSFVFGKGVFAPILSFESGRTVPYEPNVFPIPIPTTATSVTLSVTNSTIFMAVVFYTFDPATNAYTLVSELGSGWQQGQYTGNFSAGQASCFTIVCKNPNDAKFNTEPSDFTINFN